MRPWCGSRQSTAPAVASVTVSRTEGRRLEPPAEVPARQRAIGLGELSGYPFEDHPAAIVAGG